MIIITIRDETMHSYHMPSKFQPFGRGTRSPHIELHDLPTLNPPLFYIRVWVPLFSGFLHRYFLIQFWLFSLISSLAYILTLSLSHTHYASEYSTLLELDSLHFALEQWRVNVRLLKFAGLVDDLLYFTLLSGEYLWNSICGVSCWLRLKLWLWFSVRFYLIFSNYK